MATFICTDNQMSGVSLTGDGRGGLSLDLISTPLFLFGGAAMKPIEIVEVLKEKGGISGPVIGLSTALGIRDLGEVLHLLSREPI